ncbi:MAG: helix-turn-helix domain-containing protein [Myxococcota bacterium]
MSDLETELRRVFDEIRADAEPPHRAATARRILDGSLDAFATGPYDSITTRMIARTVGVAEKTLFAHFPSKATIFAEALRPIITRLIAPAQLGAFLSLLDEPEITARTRLRRVLRNRLEFAAANPKMMRVVANAGLSNAAFRTLLAEQWMMSVGHVAIKRVVEAQQSGELRPVPLQQLALFLMSFVLGFATYRTFGERLDADEAEIDGMLDLLFGGIATRED